MAARVSRVLLISNGHGEDLSGARLGQALRQRGLIVEALPLVGHGNAYRRAGLTVLGATRDFSTGGLGYTSLRGRLTELWQGQLPYLLGRLLAVWRCRQRCDWVVAVGDVLPVLAAWLTAKPMAVYLVAYSSHYEGRLRLPWPCGWLLRRPQARLLWTRDTLTASDLARQLGRPVDFVGNPFQEMEEAALPMPPLPAGDPVLGLLPGSRLPEALSNMLMMLKVLTRLPSRWHGRLRILVALVSSLSPEAIADAASQDGWRLEIPSPACRAGQGSVLVGSSRQRSAVGDGGHRLRAGGGTGQAGPPAGGAWPPVHSGRCRGPTPPAGAGGELRAGPHGSTGHLVGNRPPGLGATIPPGRS
ncbi:MAG: lipid-A-disaccharide synthase-related protein [Cyanobacteriota bacterium]